MDEVEGRVRGFRVHAPVLFGAWREPASEGSRVVGRGRSRRSPPRPASAPARGKPVHHPGLAPARTIARRRGDVQTPRPWRRPRGTATTPEHERLEEARTGTAPWKAWGPYLSERQWGTVREDYSAGRRRLELLHPRPGALARLPLGRGRHRRHLRRPPAAVPRARAVERRRPDPQGADVRADQRRGQPRRGRQGVLLLPRQHADALVPEVPVQVPAARRSRTTTSSPTNRRRGKQRAASTSCSTPASSTTTATSTSSSSTPRPRPTTS